MDAECALCYEGTPTQYDEGEEFEEEDLNVSLDELNARAERLQRELNNVERERQEQYKMYLLKSNWQTASLQIILDMVPTVVFCKDRQGRFIMANKAASQVFNTPVTELLGKTIAQVHSNAMEAALMERDDREVLSTRMTKVVQEEVFHDAFRQAHIFCSVKTPYIIPKTGELAILQIAVDITRQKAIEMQLSQTHQYVRQHMNKRTEFLSNLTHEVRTPLTGILCAASLLLDSHLSPAQSAYVNKIHRQSEALLSLVGNIINFSQIQAETIRLETVTFSLPKVLEDVFEFHTGKANEKKLAISLAPYPEDTPLMFIGDKHRIWHIISNLVHNAVKFTSQGNVQIGMKAEPNLTPVFSQKEQQPDPNSNSNSVPISEYWITIHVQDTGPGLTNSQITEILSEDFSYNQNKGVGLPLSRKLAKLMQGQITCESRPGQGSTFYFKLPLRVAKNAVPQERSYMRHVLLAEDVYINALLTEKMLKKLGITVDIVTNGEEAIKNVKNKFFDLILMDLHMPVMDGFQASEIIRTIEPSIPIIALTATAIEVVAIRCSQVGMKGIITKPITKDSLIQELDKWLLGPTRRIGPFPSTRLYYV